MSFDLQAASHRPNYLIVTYGIVVVYIRAGLHPTTIFSNYFFLSLDYKTLLCFRKKKYISQQGFLILS